jgi:preprotein translocase subunit SecG
MKNIFNYVVIADAALISLLILIQIRGATLGAGMGGGGEVHTVRRGSDKTLHQFTIIAVVVFVVSIIASIVSF